MACRKLRHNLSIASQRAKKKLILSGLEARPQGTITLVSCVVLLLLPLLLYINVLLVLLLLVQQLLSSSTNTSFFLCLIRTQKANSVDVGSRGFSPHLPHDDMVTACYSLTCWSPPVFSVYLSRPKRTVPGP